MDINHLFGFSFSFLLLRTTTTTTLSFNDMRSWPVRRRGARRARRWYTTQETRLLCIRQRTGAAGSFQLPFRPGESGKTNVSKCYCGWTKKVVRYYASDSHYSPKCFSFFLFLFFLEKEREKKPCLGNGRSIRLGQHKVIPRT